MKRTDAAPERWALPTAPHSLLARLLGGGIDAWSEVGAGSCFTLRLRFAKPLRRGTGADAGESDD